MKIQSLFLLYFNILHFVYVLFQGFKVSGFQYFDYTHFEGFELFEEFEMFEGFAESMCIFCTLHVDKHLSVSLSLSL